MSRIKEDNIDLGSQRSLDIRFLKVVDKVLSANRLAGVKPDSDSSLSSLIASGREIIAKIRNGTRGCNPVMMERLATMFDLDYNCFFRDIEDIYYTPRAVTKSKKKVIKNSAEGATTIQIQKGDMKGNIYNGEIKNNVERVVNLIPEDVRMKYENLLSDLYGGFNQLSADLEQRTKDIKKISDTSERKIRQLQKELDQEKGKKNEITEKYIALLEKIK